jgi:aryl-alcohol dehydrogenase-like predicted oxidoreductase
MPRRSTARRPIMSDAIAQMTYRRLGLTRFRVDVVGFGTCQLRLKSQQQGIDTLKTGFRLGVNLVHTAPDYEGTDDLVAQAVRESGGKVIVASQGYGDGHTLSGCSRKPAAS